MEKKLSHNNRSFEDDIKNKLQDASFVPSPHIWGKIENELHPCATRPAGVIWFKNKMFYSIFGLLFMLGLSATGARYILKNVSRQYQEEKLQTLVSKKVNTQFIDKLNTNNNNKNTLGDEYLSSAGNNPISKVNSYLEDLISSENTSSAFTVSHENQENTKGASSVNTSTTTSLEPANGVIVNNEIQAPSNNALFYLLQQNLMELSNNYQSTLMGSTIEKEEEIELMRRFYKVKGFYIGPNLGVDATLPIKKDKQSNPVLGENIHYRTGVSTRAGILMRYQFNHHVGLEAAINYMQKLKQFQSVKNESATSGKLKLTYLEIPVNLKYQFNPVNGESKHTSYVSIYTGIQYAMLTHSNVDMELKNAKRSKMTNLDVNNNLANHNIGINAGIDYDLVISKNLFWNIGINAGVNRDATLSAKIKTFSPSPEMTIGIHTGIKFFSPGKIK